MFQGVLSFAQILYSPKGIYEYNGDKITGGGNSEDVEQIDRKDFS
jgi:hypothetical protein